MQCGMKDFLNFTVLIVGGCNISHLLGLSGGLGEDSQEKLCLFVGMKRARNDDVVARLELAVDGHLTEVREAGRRLC